MRKLTKEDLKKLGTGEIQVSPKQREEAKILGQRIKQNSSTDQNHTKEQENKR